jgi:hypothetical protein
MMTIPGQEMDHLHHGQGQSGFGCPASGLVQPFVKTVDQSTFDI